MTETNPEISTAYWNLSIDALYKVLGTTSAGLSHEEAQDRLIRFGPNSIQVKEELTAPRLFLKQFESPIILILLLATGVSAVVKDWLDAIIILFIVLGSAFLSFSQEYSASNAVEKLRLQISAKVIALRDGKPQTIEAHEVVPGDILLLSAGSLTPADGVVIEAKDCFLNQAALTGETFPVEKKPGVLPANSNLAERTNMVFMGTSVHSGSATVVVVETGRRTAYGKISARLSLRPPENEFQRGVKHLGYLLSEVMFVLVLGIFAFNVFFHKPILDSLLFSIALAVGLTPQLLPAIININLARGSQAMAGQGVIVRRLEAIENFGSMNILCTDKTGTLTEGVVKLDAALDPIGQPSEQVLQYAYLNARFQTGLSSPLDDAILAAYPNWTTSFEKADEIPYDFARKRLSVIVRTDKENAPWLMITKGAFHTVITICEYVLRQGEAIPLEDAQLQQINQQYTDWSLQGYRVLGVATRSFSSPLPIFQRDDEQHLCFVGFLLFYDPPKPGVKVTLQQLDHAGVQIKIITGDNRLVASHIAQAVGINSQEILTGEQIDASTEEALWRKAEKTVIFAEVDPVQKERVILALKKTGHVVGYMGDGINDAPALHSADVGISVMNAVDVAKEAADIVLLKQDLAVLLQGIFQGRRTLANTLKYIFMATSANFGNMFSVAGASLFLPFLPMLPKQILLINFLSDLPEMTISGDHVDAEFLARPHRLDVGFIQRFMLVFGSLSSLFDYLTFGVLLILLHADQKLFHTAWFIESVLSAALVVFALRTRLPIGRSNPSQTMLLVTMLVGVIVLILPFTPLSDIMGFRPLSPGIMLLIGVIVVSYFASAELVKRWFFQKFLG